MKINAKKVYKVRPPMYKTGNTGNTGKTGSKTLKKLGRKGVFLGMNWEEIYCQLGRNWEEIINKLASKKYLYSQLFPVSSHLFMRLINIKYSQLWKIERVLSEICDLLN